MNERHPETHRRQEVASAGRRVGCGGRRARIAVRKGQGDGVRRLTPNEQEAVDRMVAAAVEQGLGPTITDPDVLDKAAALWRAGIEKKR